VVGLALRRAETKIRKAHCRTGKVSRRRVARARRGRVIAQSPRAGRRLANGARVSLVVGRR
jgi:beta-lactam-binding protein with PASTA domain